MNQQAIDYLQANKDAYSKASLVEQLKNAGYAESDITEAVQFVYEGKSSSDLPQPNSPTSSDVEAKGKSGVGKGVLIGCGIAAAIIIPIIFILTSIVLVSLNSAREKAKEASIKSSVSSTVPAAIICMDEKVDLSELVPRAEICPGVGSMWPELDPSAKWGEMVDADVSDGTFEYTAIYGPEGEKKAVCTEFGCTFSN